MRTLPMLLAMCCCATICAAEWEVVSVSAEPFGGDAPGGAKELMLSVRVRNVSGKPIFVPARAVTDGETVPVVALFVQGDSDSVWKKLTQGGSERTADANAKWKDIAPSEVMCCKRLIAVEQAGRRMLVSLRCAGSRHDKEGNEILVGPITVPSE